MKISISDTKVMAFRMKVPIRIQIMFSDHEKYYDTDVKFQTIYGTASR